MELLLQRTRNEYLQEASLESLHAECVVWLSQLNFWNQEMTFFNNVVHLRKLSGTVLEHVLEVETECGELVSALTKAKKSVSDHEGLLVTLCQSQCDDRERCCRGHRALINEMYSLHKETRILRTKVFKLITR
jgi:hypothetical protein